MSKWLNKKNKIHGYGEVEKPCHKCKFCPYGQLVEAFPIGETRTNYSCKVFGHDCPVYYHAEGLMEEE